nr:sce7725 family protein [Dyella sp. ASV24]
MYHPYFRGKQFELLTIRETAALLAASNFVPIIEPVREALTGLGRALKSICEANGSAIVIVNPDFGDHAQDGADISAFLKAGAFDSHNVAAGILLKKEMSVEGALAYHDEHANHAPVFVHAGFLDAKALAEKLGEKLGESKHVFLEEHCGKPYRKHFKGATRILVRDGFKRQRNADYPDVEQFSDLHVTYEEEGMNGFGDFLIVGNDYTEGGGPAYAVAIHLTYIDPSRDDVMYTYHFVSETRDTPTDPAGKFSQALSSLVKKLDTGESNVYETEAVAEFRDLHAKEHFPGLGYVKKLSMKHHIETLARYFA